MTDEGFTRALSYVFFAMALVMTVALLCGFCGD
jgi:hypothetical protein